MPTVSKSARATIRDTAIWRTCPACQQLAAMAPEAPLCDSCAAAPDNTLSSMAPSRSEGVRSR